MIRRLVSWNRFVKSLITTSLQTFNYFVIKEIIDVKCAMKYFLQVQWNLFKSFTTSSSDDKSDSVHKTHYQCREVEENYTKHMTTQQLKGIIYCVHHSGRRSHLHCSEECKVRLGVTQLFSSFAMYHC